MYDSLGSRILVAAMLIVTGFALGSLLGFIHPVTTAAVIVASQILGTIAFFLTYIFRSREEETPSHHERLPSAPPRDRVIP